MRRAAAAALSAAFILALLAPAVASAAEPPANDMFAAAMTIPSFPYPETIEPLTVDLTTASVEPGEPDAVSNPFHTKTAWFRYVAPATGVVVAWASMYTFTDLRLVSYRYDASIGGFAGLAKVASRSLNGIIDPVSSTIRVVAGQTYYTQVSDNGSGGGPVSVKFAFFPPPPNDAFANAATPSFTDPNLVDLWAATTETGEPNACGVLNPTARRSVWYRFVAPQNGTVTATSIGDMTGGVFEGTRVAAYRQLGTGFAGLSAGVCDPEAMSVTFPVVAGAKYYVQALDFNGWGTLDMEFSFAVPDGTPPTITGTPADISVTSTDPAGAVVTYASPTATDDVSGVVPVTCVPASGSTFRAGTTTVTCTTWDAAGNSATTSFAVTVTLDASGDTTPPTFGSTPSDVTATAYGPYGTAVGYMPPSAVDDFSGPVPVTCAPPPWSVFQIGTTHVTCSASDAAGNVASTGFDVTVVRVLPPPIPPIVPIVSYDVDDAAMSGSGCWRHEYTGTVIDAGRTFDSGGTCPPSGGHLAAYHGGSGTLNDGLDALSTDEDQLFFVGQTDSGGTVIDPAITLHLDGEYVVSRIRVYGGHFSGNVLPGALSRATVEIGGRSVTLDTTPFGFLGAFDTPTADLLDLTGTALARTPTDTVVLRGFSTAWFGQFSIAEITVEGSPPDTAPPVPSISGAAGPYAVDAHISISGTATDLVDPAPAVTCTLAGPAGTNLVPCEYSADAWSLGALGSYTFTVSATDAAGNTASTPATFDVVATYASVENLTRQFSSKATVAKDLVAILESARAAEARGTFTAEANKLKDYRAGVKAQSGKAFTADQAALLILFSNGL